MINVIRLQCGFLKLEKTMVPKVNTGSVTNFIQNLNRAGNGAVRTIFRGSPTVPGYLRRVETILAQHQPSLRVPLTFVHDGLSRTKADRVATLRELRQNPSFADDVLVATTFQRSAWHYFDSLYPTPEVLFDCPDAWAANLGTARDALNGIEADLKDDMTQSIRSKSTLTYGSMFVASMAVLVGSLMRMDKSRR
jgi:hypothetical protein